MSISQKTLPGVLFLLAAGAAGQPVQVRDAVGGVDGKGQEWFLLEGTASVVAGTNATSDVIRGLDIGAFDLEIDTGEGDGWQPLVTYCLELGVDLGMGVNTSGTATGITYVVADLGDHPGLLPSEAAMLQVLWTHALNDSLTDEVGAAAFQAIVWELATDDTFDLSSGAFRLDPTDFHTAEVEMQAEAWFALIEDGTWAMETPLKMLTHESSQNLVVPESALQCQAALSTIAPNNCAIDARQPTTAQDTIPLGPASLALAMSCVDTAPILEDFVFETIPGGGLDPAITHVEYDEGTQALSLHLDRSVSSGAWSCVTHLPSGSMKCLGFLPGDVNGNGTSLPSDILDLIDHLNGIRVPGLQAWQCDIDRSGECTPADILAEIDLLNGVGTFDVWHQRSLPPCPSAVP